jgi:hypothetical protein
MPQAGLIAVHRSLEVITEHSIQPVQVRYRRKNGRRFGHKKSASHKPPIGAIPPIGRLASNKTLPGPFVSNCQYAPKKQQIAPEFK